MFRACVLLILVTVTGSRALALDLAPPRPLDLKERVRAEVRPDPNENWLAIVGDSSATGVITHPSYGASWWTLLAHALDFVLFDIESPALSPRFGDYYAPGRFNITEPVEPMTRVLFSQAEMDAAKSSGQETERNFEAKASLRLDTGEYSFGYLVGRALNMNPAHLVMTAQDGKRVNTMATQFGRIFEVGAATLPPLVLVSYVANDFCHPNNFTRPVSEFRAEYEGDLRVQLAQIRHLRPASKGTLILVLAPLDVANILTNPRILAQHIQFQGRGDVTCGELRQGLPEERNPLARSMVDTLIGECRGVLAPSEHPQEHLTRIRDLQRTQVEVLNEVLNEFNQTSGPGLHAELATSVRDIDFQTGDVAADCFHPGIPGHARIADQLLRHELKSWTRLK